MVVQPERTNPARPPVETTPSRNERVAWVPVGPGNQALELPTPEARVAWLAAPTRLELEWRGRVAPSARAVRPESPQAPQRLALALGQVTEAGVAATPAMAWLVRLGSYPWWVARLVRLGSELQRAAALQGRVEARAVPVG